ncbi:MAG: hypothetical protein EOO56_00325 [Hymenobacter sp.]|nr:MAG: hypothetical protein EOO56_00325 [Hymenobacter sp.]
MNARQLGKEAQLATLLAADVNATKLQVTKQMYGTGSEANQTAMLRLRGRMQDKLLNHLFFLDHSDSRLFLSRRYQVECFDLLYKGTILYLEGEYNLSERLLRKCLRLAEQGEFTSYAELACQRLRIIYSEQRQQQQYDLINKKLAKLRQTQACEDEAELMDTQVRLTMTRPVAARRALPQKMPTYIEEAERLHRKAGTFTTFLALYRLRMVQAELAGRYDDIIRYTTAATQLLRQGKLNERRFDQRFNQFVSVYAHLRSRQYKAGLKLAEVYAADFHPTSSNWFYFYEHYILLALHAGDYNQALRLLHVAQKNPSFPKQRPAAQERWELLQAYVEFVQPAEALPTRRRNQLALFASLTVPEYTRDKRGHNVAILVLQLLHYLRQRELEPVLARLERLRKYQQRHLRDAATLRSRLLLRLLVLLPEVNFDPVLLAKRGQNLLLQLSQAPMTGEADAEVEIIPYEQLWTLTLGILKNGAPQ